MKKTLRTLLELNRIDYEIILVNDGSTDNSDIVCRKVAEKANNVHYYTQENKGVSTARNVGLEKANGEYVIFFDSDDTIDAKALNRLLDSLLKKEDIDMAVYGMTFDYYHRRKVYYRELLVPIMIGTVKKEDWIKKLYQLYECNSLSSACNKIVRKEILIKNNIRFRKDMFIYEDMEFSLNCLQHTDKILFVDEAIYFYRQSDDQGNAGRRLKRIDNLNSLIDKIEEPLNILCPDDDVSNQKNKILLALYLTLAREKMSVSSNGEIKRIQKNFTTWWNEHRFDADNKQKTDIDRLLHQKAISFKAHNLYIRTRHFIAVRVKYMKAVGKK